MGILGGILKIGTALIAGKSAKKKTRAADAMAAQYQADALAELDRGFGEARTALTPYEQQGRQGFEDYIKFITGNPDEQLATLSQTPGYQFRLREGTRATNNGFGARGMALSGQRAKALTQFGQGLAGTYYDNHADRLAGIGNVGFSAAGALGDLAVGGAQARNDVRGDVLSQRTANLYGRAAINQNTLNGVYGGVKGIGKGIGTLLGAKGF